MRPDDHENRQLRTKYRQSPWWRENQQWNRYDGHFGRRKISLVSPGRNREDQTCTL